MRKRTLYRLVAPAALAALVLAACGNDDDDAATTTTVAEAEEATTTTEAMDDMDDMDANGDEATGGDTIVDVAMSEADFSILVEAVVAADLAGVLSGDGPFTVFAPTNDAFVALLEELGITAEELLADPNLGSILTYHVVAGEVLSSDLQPEQTVATVEGSDVEIVVTDEGAFINGIEIIATDIVASNGVIHVIDGVLIPQG